MHHLNQPQSDHLSPSERQPRRRSTPFGNLRTSGRPLRERPYTTYGPDGARDDIQARVFDIMTALSTDQNLRALIEGTASPHALIGDACIEFGPTTEEEAVELLAATRLRNTIAWMPQARELLVLGPTRVNWIEAARAALCAEFCLFRYMMHHHHEPDDLVEFEVEAARLWAQRRV